MASMIQAYRVTGIFGLVLSAGCSGQILLRIDDVVVIPPYSTRLSAFVERQYTMAFRDVLKNVEVTFTAGNKEIGRVKTDYGGRATLMTDSHLSPSEPIRAHARVKGTRMDSSARMFHWKPDTTIVAVDFDECICATHYAGLFIADEDHVSPIPGARETLCNLDKEYQILYISARPRFLTEKTRVWLNTYHFPPGPIAHAEWFDACLFQEKSKHEMLVNLRTRWPNLLIGIGDKGTDDNAYGKCGMFSLIVQPKAFHQYTSRSVLFKDWTAMARYFQMNQNLLSNSARLASAAKDPDADLLQLAPIPSDIILTSSQ